MVLHNFQLLPHELLPCPGVSVIGKHSHCTQKTQDFEQFPSLKLLQILPSTTSTLDILYYENPCKISDHGPANSGPNHVSLNLHEFNVSFIR